MAPATASAIANLLDPFPRVSRLALGRVVDACGDLRVPANPLARREELQAAYDQIRTAAFDQTQLHAAVDEALAWFNLGTTAVQAVMIVWAGLKQVVTVTLRYLGEKSVSSLLDAADILNSVVNGLAHGAELCQGLSLAYCTATAGTGAVRGLVR